MTERRIWIVYALLVIGFSGWRISCRKTAEPDTVDRSLWAQGFRTDSTMMAGWGVMWIDSFDPLILRTKYRHGFKPGDFIQIVDLPGPASVNGPKSVRQSLDAYRFAITEPSGLPVDTSMYCTGCHLGPSAWKRQVLLDRSGNK